MKVKSLSCVQLLATPRTAAYQAPPSMGFSKPEYWSGLPLPSPEQHEVLTKNEAAVYKLALKDLWGVLCRGKKGKVYILLFVRKGKKLEILFLGLYLIHTLAACGLCVCVYFLK